MLYAAAVERAQSIQRAVGPKHQRHTAAEAEAHAANLAGAILMNLQSIEGLGQVLRSTRPILLHQCGGLVVVSEECQLTVIQVGRKGKVGFGQAGEPVYYRLGLVVQSPPFLDHNSGRPGTLACRSAQIAFHAAQLNHSAHLLTSSLSSSLSRSVLCTGNTRCINVWPGVPARMAGEHKTMRWVCQRAGPRLRIPSLYRTPVLVSIQNPLRCPASARCPPLRRGGATGC